MGPAGWVFRWLGGWVVGSLDGGMPAYYLVGVWVAQVPWWVGGCPSGLVGGWVPRCTHGYISWVSTCAAGLVGGSLGGRTGGCLGARARECVSSCVGGWPGGCMGGRLHGWLGAHKVQEMETWDMPMPYHVSIRGCQVTCASVGVTAP
eukprot:636684-Prorocentrum_lima.AAC.1